MVRCRSGRSRAPDVLPADSNRSRSARGESNRSCATASSMASGRPARRWQSSAYAGTSSGDGRTPTDSARSNASAPAGWARTSSTVVASRDGRSSGSTTYSRSPLTRSGERLETSTVSVGHSAVSCPIWTAELSRCSKLSSTSSSRESRSCAATKSNAPGASMPARPSARPIVAMTADASASGASETCTTPSGKSPASTSDTAAVSRVLPTPPGPVSVTKRAPERIRSAIEAMSSSRPNNGVGGTSRPVGPLTGPADGLRRVPAAMSAARSSSDTPSASESERTVCGYGLFRVPRSSELIACVVSSARSASSCWVSPARSRSERRSAPNCPPGFASSPVMSVPPPLQLCEQCTSAARGLWRARPPIWMP